MEDAPNSPPEPTPPQKPRTPAKPRAAAKPRTAANPRAAAKPQTAAKPRAAAKPQTAAKPRAAAKPRTPVKPTVAAEPPIVVVEPTVTATPAAPVKADTVKADTVKPRTPAARKPAVKRAPAAKKPATTVAKIAPAATSTVAKVARTTKTTVDRTPRPKAETILKVVGLTKRFGETVAVNQVDLDVKAGSFYGIVGPNGAGKTTTLSMITGLLRPDAGTITVHGADVWADSSAAKRSMGVLPDRLRLFDRLTGAQLLYYAGVLRGMDKKTVRSRTSDLAVAFGLEDAMARLVSDYSAGMAKKVALASAMIHSPRLLVLDEPFESVDPVSASTVTDILKKYVRAGGTVLLSSHSMELVQRICDNVAVVVGGEILADGSMTSVRKGLSLEERFVELSDAKSGAEGLEWLHSFSG